MKNRVKRVRRKIDRFDPGGLYLYHSESASRMSTKVADCMMGLAVRGIEEPVTIYDLTMGAGTNVLMAVTKYYSKISHIYGADVSSENVDITAANLDLITIPAAITERKDALHEKHAGNVKLFRTIRNIRQQAKIRPKVLVTLFQANVFTYQREDNNGYAVLVSDVPHGRQSKWIDCSGNKTDENMLPQFLESIVNQNYQRVVIATDTRKRSEIAVRQRYNIAEMQKMNGRQIFLGCL